VRLIHNGRHGPAARLLRDVNAHRRNNFDVLHLWGSARVLEGRLDDGIRLLEEAAAIAPQATAVWLNLGSAYEKAGKLAEAAKAYTKALVVTPNSAIASHRLAAAYLALGDVEAATAQAEAFFAQFPGNDFANLSIGLVRMRQGRSDEAIESFRKAIELDPQNSFARQHLEQALAAKAG
jgi:tetratricopeptide (TPR) repeat protein